jgi:hypothetical protein
MLDECAGERVTGRSGIAPQPSRLSGTYAVEDVSWSDPRVLLFEDCNKDGKYAERREGGGEVADGREERGQAGGGLSDADDADSDSVWLATQDIGGVEAPALETKALTLLALRIAAQTEELAAVLVRISAGAAATTRDAQHAAGDGQPATEPLVAAAATASAAAAADAQELACGEGRRDGGREGEREGERESASAHVRRCCYARVYLEAQLELLRDAARDVRRLLRLVKDE